MPRGNDGAKVIPVLLDVVRDFRDASIVQDVVTDLGGRFKYPWEVNQFGFLGTTVAGGVSLTF